MKNCNRAAFYHHFLPWLVQGLYGRDVTVQATNWLTGGHTPRLERHDLIALSTSESSRIINMSLHVCSIIEDCLSKVHCIGCLCWRPVIVSTESICRRPAIICCADMPAMTAAVEAVPLVECAENTSVSKSLTFRIYLIHLAIVRDCTGLCGAWWDRDIYWLSSVFLNWDTEAMYTSKDIVVCLL